MSSIWSHLVTTFHVKPSTCCFRGALGAINVQDRLAYVKLMQKLLGKEFRCIFGYYETGIGAANVYMWTLTGVFYESDEILTNNYTNMLTIYGHLWSIMVNYDVLLMAVQNNQDAKTVSDKDETKFYLLNYFLFARYVLNADEYDDSMFQGPPRNLPRDEVFNLFGESQLI